MGAASPVTEHDGGAYAGSSHTSVSFTFEAGVPISGLSWDPMVGVGGLEAESPDGAEDEDSVPQTSPDSDKDEDSANQTHASSSWRANSAQSLPNFIILMAVLRS